jgi:hypothetical protein
MHKVYAILGALRGGSLNVLVTNELVALRLLQLEREFRADVLSGLSRAGIAEISVQVLP